MADDVLMQKLASIDRWLRQVREFVGGDMDRLKQQLVQDAVVLNLQRACEQAIDAAARVVSIRRLGVPADSAEAFTLLERAGALTPGAVQGAVSGVSSIGAALTRHLLSVHRRLRRNRCHMHTTPISAAPGAGTVCGASLEPNTHASLLPSTSMRSLAPNMAISHWPFTSVQ